MSLDHVTSKSSTHEVGTAAPASVTKVGEEHSDPGRMANELKNGEISEITGLDISEIRSELRLLQSKIAELENELKVERYQNRMLTRTVMDNDQKNHEVVSVMLRLQGILHQFGNDAVGRKL